MDKTGTKWNREETILALDLYCKTPFGKVNARNPEIIELADLLGRTPSSVSLKMSNLAHYDPSLQERNIVGMAHGSKLDEEIFLEYYQNIGELKEKAESIKQELGVDFEKSKSIIEEIDLLPGETTMQFVKRRIGQAAFREAVLNAYGNRCCVTGLGLPQLINASHIKPWAVSDDKTEKTNPRNGLCLNALHDRAFDRGLITIDKHFRVIESNQLLNADMDETMKQWLHKYNGETINLPERFKPAIEFIEYHNDVIFLK